MADVPLFHHALGQTPGFKSFAADLRRAGQVVNAPDHFDGKVFDDLNEGVAYAGRAGFPSLVERGVAAAVDEAELFDYPGEGHPFAEPGAESDAAAAQLPRRRAFEFLVGID